MFQQLRQGSQLYILHKGEQPSVETGSVSAIGQPKPKFQTNYNPYLPSTGQEMLVDLTVKIGDQVLDLSGLPASADMVDLSASGKAIIVATSREAMLAQIEALMATSKQIVESVDYHRNVVQGCEAILQQFNPQLAERKAQEQLIDRMSQEMGNMRNEFGELKSILSRLLNQNGNSRGEGEKKQSSAPNPKNN